MIYSTQSTLQNLKIQVSWALTWARWPWAFLLAVMEGKGHGSLAAGL